MESSLTIDWSAGMLLAWVSIEAEWVGMRVETGVTTVGRIGEGKDIVTEVEHCWVTKQLEEPEAAGEELEREDDLPVDSAAVLLTVPELQVRTAAAEVGAEGIAGLIAALAA